MTKERSDLSMHVALASLLPGLANPASTTACAIMTPMAIAAISSEFVHSISGANSLSLLKMLMAAA
ncbi:hypothetical protein [Nitrosomonas sp. Nm132]|uniref:hypothetical protein n=1 Tax=Nitrosomonas sp. Nm132 TaxID=1881053 RepID=UPI00115FD114|nr:hypothetical protein [Nitrosomonas sp. Nm132]